VKVGHDLGRFLLLFALWGVLWLGALFYMARHANGGESRIAPLLDEVSWLRQLLMYALAIPAAIAGTILLFTGLIDPDWIESAAIFVGTGVAGLGWTLWRRHSSG
jgi:hypothetical protein